MFFFSLVFFPFFLHFFPSPLPHAQPPAHKAKKNTKTGKTKIEMLVFTVATHADGWWDALVASADRGGYELRPLGWGATWGGFTWRLDRLLEALADEADVHRLVGVVDAYDTVFLEPAEELVARYRKLAPDGGAAAVLVGAEAPVPAPAARLLKRAVFGRACGGPWTLNAGAYVAPLGALRTFLLALRMVAAAAGTTDDQKALNHVAACPTLGPALCVDTVGDVLFHAACAGVVDLARGRCATLGLDPATLCNPRTRRRPCVLHAPGGLDLDPVCRTAGLPLIPPHHRRARLAWLWSNFRCEALVLCACCGALVLALVFALCAKQPSTKRWLPVATMM